MCPQGLYMHAECGCGIQGNLYSWAEHLMLCRLPPVAVCWASSARDHTQLSLLDAVNLLWDLQPCRAAVPHCKQAGPLKWQISRVYGIGS